MKLGYMQIFGGLILIAQHQEIIQECIFPLWASNRNPSHLATF